MFIDKLFMPKEHVRLFRSTVGVNFT